MGKSILKAWVKSKATGKSSNFTDGKGKVIIRDVRVDATHKDEFTYILETQIKESQAVRDDVKPNAPGTTVGYVQLLSTYDSAQGNAKAANLAILGPEAEGLEEDALSEQFVELMRLNDDGVTKKGTECPVRGAELAYETYRQWTKDRSKELTLIRFRHVPFDEAAVAANLAVLDGAGAGAGGKAA